MNRRMRHALWLLVLLLAVRIAAAQAPRLRPPITLPPARRSSLAMQRRPRPSLRQGKMPPLTL